MATTDFTNATLKLLIEDRDGIVTVASLQQADVPPPIHAATIILTDAQIRALPGTPVVIVPATETLNYSGFPSKLFFPTKVYGVLDTRGGAYGNITNGNPFLAWGGADLSQYIASGFQVTFGNSPLSINTSGIGSQLFATYSPGIVVFSMFIAEGVIGTDGLYDNSIALSIFNSGSLTGGNPDNTLKIVVQYFEVDIP